MRSKDFLSYRLNGILNGLSNAVVVAPGIINLQHRKLRGVGLIDALITEVAVDLKDLIDTTNDSPLEEKLRSDTQRSEERRVGKAGSSRSGEAQHDKRSTRKSEA